MADDLTRSPGFGALLRQYRVAAALSQEALAEQAGLSTRAISDLERGVKTRPHLETVRLLTEALDLDATGRAALLDAARPSRPPTPSNLPVPLTSLVGREADVARVRELLGRAGTRLLTLIGPGGVGKTRLALQVAAAADGFPDGVTFVSLAGLAAPDLVPAAIAQALGVREAGGRPLPQALQERLRGQSCLLVLDNLEHLRAAAPFLADLLAACPDVVILATSRVSLRLTAEHLVPVPPLTVPDPARLPPLPALARVAAVALFVQRAQAVRPDFALTAANAADVAAVCARLDGLPLALELAAVRLRALSPAALRALLGDQLQLLDHGPVDAPPRQRTMRAALAWSNGLLAPAERALFHRLAVFAGGCTLEDAAAVTGDGDPFATLDGLEALLDASLLERRDGMDGAPWFVMLEPVRAFAWEQLAASGEEEPIRRAHAACYLALAEQGELELSGAQQRTWLARLRVEADNLRAALGWAMASGDAGTALRLGGALWPFWAATGRLGEGTSWLERALALGGAAAPAARAKALLRLGNLAIDLADYPRARDLYQTSLTIRRELGDDVGAAAALTGLGLVWWNQGDYEAARAAHEAALQLWQATGDRRGVALTLQNLGSVAMAEGKLAEARQSYAASLALRQAAGDAAGGAYASLLLGQLARLEGRPAEARHRLAQSLTAFRDLGDLIGRAYTLYEVGRLAQDEGDTRSARAHLSEALALRQQVGDVQGTVECLEGIAILAIAGGQPDRGVRLLAAAAAWRAARGAPAPPPLTAAPEGALAAARAVLSPAAFTAAWETGRALPLEQAAADATTSEG